MGNDVETDFYLMMDKIKKNTGDIKIVQKFSGDITQYFLKEFYSDNYDIKKLNDDIIDICSQIVCNEKYKSLKDILSIEDLQMIIAVICNQLEDYINLYKENE